MMPYSKTNMAQSLTDGARNLTQWMPSKHTTRLSHFISRLVAYDLSLRVHPLILLSLLTIGNLVGDTSREGRLSLRSVLLPLQRYQTHGEDWTDWRGYMHVMGVTGKLCVDYCTVDSWVFLIHLVKR